MSYTDTPALSYLPTLVVDSNSAAATELADQLRHYGFSTDIAITCRAAHAAARSRYYGSLVFVGDLGQPADMECLAGLRQRLPRTWIVVISSTAASGAQEWALPDGADALLIAPFSTQDLATQLFAFSLRLRSP
jgi:DNA-binding response OmpR family regulator